MNNKNSLFGKVFASRRNDDGPIFNSDELPLATFVYDVAYDEIHKRQDLEDRVGTDSDLCFNKKVEAVVQNFERVVQLFKISSKAQNAFLKNFDNWSSFRKSNVQRLKEIAEEIQTDKFNSDIATVVGGVVGAVGGIVFGLSLLTPLAAVTVPLAISGGVASALGGGVIVGTAGTKIGLLKTKLEEVKTLVIQEKESFKSMQKWFTHSDELKAALESFLDYDVLNEMSVLVQKFLNEVSDKRNLMVGDFKNRFKQVLKLCMGKMCKLSKIRDKFGDCVASVVMTFVFVVCLMRDHNRIVLDCVIITQRSALGLMSMLDLGVQAGQLLSGLATKGTVAAGRIVPGAVARIAVMGTFVALGVAIDVLSVVLSSIDIHKRPQAKNAEKVKNAAEQLEKEFLFIENVYNELSRCRKLFPLSFAAISHNY